MKRAALSAESLSRMPPRCLGWLAMIPAGRPPKRARQVMIVLAHWGFQVEVPPVVDDPADHLVHVVGLAVRFRQHVEELLVAAVDRILGGLRPAGPASQCDGK